MKIFKKDFWVKVGKFASKHKPLSIIIVMVVFALFANYFLKSSATTSLQYVFGKVTKGDLVVSVSGSGQVATLSEVDIKPQTTGQTQTLGQIVSVKVQNGDLVKAGQIVAILDGKTTLQSLNQAQANLESAQANYDKLINGPTASDLQSYQSSLQNSQLSVQNYQQNILIKLQNAYTSAANAVYINTDPFFTNPMNISAQFSVPGVTFSNQQIQDRINLNRVKIGGLLNDWKNEINNASTTSDMPTLINSALSRLTIIRGYFDDMTSLFASYAQSNSSSGQSSINSDKGVSSSARSSMDSSISDLTSTLQGYQSSLNSFNQSQQSYNFKIAPPAQSDIVISKSQLSNAQAAYTTAEQNYASRIITAPFDGQIGGLTAQVGQQISSSDSLGKLITPNKVVNVTLNEVDAAKVEKGDAVILTFDALPNLSIPGHISYVDPLGNVSQGVVSYAVQIAMDEQNSQIETGMTASAQITTDSHLGVLIVPSSAITIKGNRSFVLAADATTTNSGTSTNQYNNFGGATSTFSGASTTRRFNASSSRVFGSSSSINSAATAGQPAVHQVEITTGISNDTITEVVSGLTEGEQIVIRTITTSTTGTKTAAASATTRSTGARVGGGIGGFGGGSVGAAVLR